MSEMVESERLAIRLEAAQTALENVITGGATGRPLEHAKAGLLCTGYSNDDVSRLLCSLKREQALTAVVMRQAEWREAMRGLNFRLEEEGFGGMFVPTCAVLDEEGGMRSPALGLKSADGKHRNCVKLAAERDPTDAIPYLIDWVRALVADGVIQRVPQ